MASNVGSLLKTASNAAKRQAAARSAAKATAAQIAAQRGSEAAKTGNPAQTPGTQ